MKELNFSELTVNQIAEFFQLEENSATHKFLADFTAHHRAMARIQKVRDILSKSEEAPWLLIFDHIGIGGDRGTGINGSTIRIPQFSELGSGRKFARDGEAWDASIKEFWNTFFHGGHPVVSVEDDTIVLESLKHDNQLADGWVKFEEWVVESIEVEFIPQSSFMKYLEYVLTNKHDGNAHIENMFEDTFAYVPYFYKEGLLEHFTTFLRRMILNQANLTDDSDWIEVKSEVSDWARIYDRVQMQIEWLTEFLEENKIQPLLLDSNPYPSNALIALMMDDYRKIHFSDDLTLECVDGGLSIKAESNLLSRCVDSDYVDYDVSKFISIPVLTQEYKERIEEGEVNWTGDLKFWVFEHEREVMKNFSKFLSTLPKDIKIENEEKLPELIGRIDEIVELYESLD